MKHIQLIREQWDIDLQEAKLEAQSEGISSDFSLSRHLSTQSEAEQHYKVKVFITIFDSIMSSLQCRFNSLRHICTLFGFLWQFNTDFMITMIMFLFNNKVEDNTFVSNALLMIQVLR